MAKRTNEADDAQQAQADEFRERLQNAYTFVEAQKTTQSFSALTPEDCFDRFIERVSGKDTQARPNVLNRITKVKNEVLASVEKIKALPPESFRKPKPTEDANPPVEAYDPE